MASNTRIYDKWQGFTVADCDCRLCLYYGGTRKGVVKCLADECVCKQEIEEAFRRERMKNGSKD